MLAAHIISESYGVFRTGEGVNDISNDILSMICMNEMLHPCRKISGRLYSRPSCSKHIV